MDFRIRRQIKRKEIFTSRKGDTLERKTYKKVKGLHSKLDVTVGESFVKGDNIQNEDFTKDFMKEMTP